MKENPQDRGGWLRLANAWKVLGDHAGAIDAYAKADALGPVDARVLADWAEAHVRGLKPGEPPSPAAVAVLERLEKAEPRNGLALFYLGAASFAAGDKAAAARRWKTLLALLPGRRADPRHAGRTHQGRRVSIAPDRHLPALNVRNVTFGGRCELCHLRGLRTYDTRRRPTRVLGSAYN